jgi:hypothetical protein
VSVDRSSRDRADLDDKRRQQTLPRSAISTPRAEPPGSVNERPIRMPARRRDAVAANA